jgi:poly(3-hydroxybutyrate) depolymerase
VANPNRCWDFWGYSGSNYYTRIGSQMRAVKAMIDRLLSRFP